MGRLEWKERVRQKRASLLRTRQFLQESSGLCLFFLHHWWSGEGKLEGRQTWNCCASGREGFAVNQVSNLMYLGLLYTEMAWGIRLREIEES